MKQKLIQTLKKTDSLEDFFFYGVKKSKRGDDPFSIPMRSLVLIMLIYLVVFIPFGLIFDGLWKWTEIGLFNPNGWFGLLVTMVLIVFISIPTIALKIAKPISKALSKMRILLLSKDTIKTLIIKELSLQKAYILEKFEGYENLLENNIEQLSNEQETISERRMAELLQMDVKSIEILDKEALRLVIQGKIDYFDKILRSNRSYKEETEEYQDYLAVQNVHQLICT